MIRIGKILFPTDFSPCAEQALGHALYLANKYQASLHVLHAIVLHEDDPHDPSAHFTDIVEIQQRLQDLARTEMQAAISARPDATGEVVMRQRRGISAADVILEYAALEDIDLVVMGTHGRRGLGRLLLGSVAERVVRFSSCPVLTIREHEHPKPIAETNRILVPVDYSDHSKAAIRHARAIAATYGASLELLHVIEEAPRPEFYDEVGFRANLVEADAGEKAKREMRGLYESSPGPEVEARCHAFLGLAGPDIVRFAEDTGVDLIVIATHGLTGLPYLLMGSVAEAIVRMSPCPVCTVKSFGKSLVVGAGDSQSAAVGQ
jgi:nucleotide-binding universal stress UspA family protein